MPPLLELREATKRFGPTLALDCFDFDVQAGEVHALVGENGAGKSTALGLMYGVASPDTGTVAIRGKQVSLGSIAQAQAMGIGCVFQELSLAEGLSVAENVFAGRAPSRAGLVNWAELRRRSRALLDDFEVKIDVTAQVGALSVGQRQIVEIAKAVSLDAQVLLLDEPTSALSPDEKRSLFRLIGKLKARGIGLVYVSHHLAEVIEISDRISVLRDGRGVACLSRGDADEKSLVRAMTGADFGHDRPSTGSGPEDAPVVLSMRDIRGPNGTEIGHLDLHLGEIVGLAGMLGSGAPRLGEMVAGLSRHRSGEMRLAGTRYAPRSLQAARRAGVAFVPEERKSDGLFMGMSLSTNVVAASLGKVSRFGLMREKAVRERAGRAIRDFSVRAAGSHVPMSSLSGGNQQKIMLSKWLQTKPRLLVVNEPTKGVDIGAKRQIHETLKRAAAAGMTILVISSDFPELAQLCDRVGIVRNGCLKATVRGADEHELVEQASGFVTANRAASGEGARK